jgi:ribosome-associated protein
MATKTKAAPKKKSPPRPGAKKAPARAGRKPAPAAKRAAPARKAPGRTAPARKAPGRTAPARKAPGPKKAAALKPPRGPAAASGVIEAEIVEVAARPAAQPDPSRPTALAIAQAGLDKKAEDVTVLDVRGLTSYADYFVIMTADSERQASAIADSIDEQLKKQGVTKVGVEGYQGGRWILVDFGDVVAHVFNRESRGFYDLEGLWADAPRFRVEG